MDPANLQTMIESFQAMAKANQDLVAAMATQRTGDMPATVPTVDTTNQAAHNDMAGAVALTSIKIPLTLGDSAEERLVNFHEWKNEVMDKLTVAGINDQHRQTTIALMWGGKDIKDYAIEKAGVLMHGTSTTNSDTWTDAITKIETKMASEINEAFAMFKFWQNEQGQRSINEWYKELKTMVKTLRLKQCTCGHGYSEERAIRDVMVSQTTDSKLRKDALSKGLSLTELLKEGEANELARSRAATVEQKTVNRIDMTDDHMTDAEANFMIAKLKRAGKYSSKSERNEKGSGCDRCVNARTPHAADKCYFKDKECRVCKQTGHMGGSKRCTKKVNRVEVSDYDDVSNWKQEGSTDRSPKKEIEIRKVGKKNVVRVKVGDVETDMFADSGADVSIVPSTWYQKGMGTLQPTKDILTPYGSAATEDAGLKVEAKFQTLITTKKGARCRCWVYVVNSKQPIQPLLGDDAATELGFLTFKPDGREPTDEEREGEEILMPNGMEKAVKEEEIMKVSQNVKIGEGTMPDSAGVPEITEKEVKECWDIVRSPKYANVFDPKRIGTMKKRSPITFHRNEEKRILSQPYRPVPPQFREELSEHLQFLRDNNKIVDVDPNTENC